MVEAVGSLIGRRLADELVVEVLMGWWAHFHGLGRVRTDHAAMEHERRACIRSTRSNPAFRPAFGESDHSAVAAAIQLDRPTEQASHTNPGPEGPEPASADPTWGKDPRPDRRDQTDQTKNQTPRPDQHQHCMGVTHIGDSESKLCRWVDEELFVQALLSQALHQRSSRPEESNLLFTHDQIRQIAAIRSGRSLPVWDNQQFQRLKRKYITREGKPAERHELLREVQKGQRGQGRNPGQPSEYEVTGLTQLLAKPC